MKRDASDILEDALALPPDDRWTLVGSRLDSLDDEIEEDAEAAWQREIARRAEVRRQPDLRTGVLATATAVAPLPNGLRWTLAGSADLLPRLASLIEPERRCCRFLRFVVQVEPDLGGITLEVTGPEGTREVLESWLPRR